jgi:hypothetical protein
LISDEYVTGNFNGVNGSPIQQDYILFIIKLMVEIELTIRCCQWAIDLFLQVKSGFALPAA